MHPLFDRPKPYILAHRGASDLAPENTVAAFAAAVEAGADIIETDLWFTADGELVCHHDATLERMTGQMGRVDQMPARRVTSLPIQSRLGMRWQSERIPTLAQALDAIPMSVMLAVELKDPRFAQRAWAEKLVRQVEARIERRQVVALAFNRRRLDTVLRVCPSFPTGYISVVEPIPVDHAQILGPFWPVLYANPGYVAQAHRQGQWVCPLDTQPGKRLARYLKLGVDAVMSNNPAALRVQIDQLSAAAAHR
ncbi:MAG: glycerophosphodiester phosphodiesterase family protein [Anaerolineae bacterium]